MNPADPNKPLFEIKTGSRHSRWLMVLAMLALMVVIIFGALRIWPGGPGAALPGREAQRLETAKAWSMEGLFHSAAEAYRRIAGDSRMSAAGRIEAAERLLKLYGDHPELPRQGMLEIEAVYRALEPGATREALGESMARVRAIPIYRHVAQDRPLTPQARPEPTEADRAFARVGQDTISIGELYYAWEQYHGGEGEGDEAFEQFVHWYLDLALLADEARRLGLGQKGVAAWDLALKQRLTLSQAMTNQLINRVHSPDPAVLRGFFEQSRATFDQPARARVARLVADTRRRAETMLEEVADLDAEAAWEQFVTWSEEDDADAVIGMISAADPAGSGLGLPAETILGLTRSEAGLTTGPFETEQGWLVLHVIESWPAVRADFDTVQPEVIQAYQQNAVVRERAALLERLRRERPIAIYGETAGEDRATTETTRAPETPSAND